jgi:phospholipid/cholesterol/gamma-HCH transport system permease protein
VNSTPLDFGIGNWIRRLVAALLLGGQTIVHLFQGRGHYRNTLEQMASVGPQSLLITIVTAIFVGAVFTIQVAREFLNFGAGSVVGGVLSLSLLRELAPVFTGVLLAGRIGSSFAAEIGTMRVTEQIDALLMLKTDPVDYLVLPRVVACCLMAPILTLVFAVTGTFGGLLVSIYFYDLGQVTFLNSVQAFLSPWDFNSAMIKSIVFGAIVAVIGSSWGLTTIGGAKGVGTSTTAAVVTSLLAIFICNFFLSGFMFQGLGETLTGG